MFVSDTSHLASPICHKCQNNAQSLVILHYFHEIPNQMLIENIEMTGKKTKKRCQEKILHSLAKGKLRGKIKISFLIS